MVVSFSSGETFLRLRKVNTFIAATKFIKISTLNKNSSKKIDKSELS